MKMTDFWAKVATEKATKQPVSVLDQRTSVPRVNESEGLKLRVTICQKIWQQPLTKLA